MKLSAALFAFFAFPTFVTSIPLLDSVNDGYVDVSVAAKRLTEQNIDKRQLSDAMVDIVKAIGIYTDEFSHYRGYSQSDFTKNIIQALINHNPHYNYVMCHPDHVYDFGSPWGVNVYNVWVSYKSNGLFGIPVNVGYDIVIGKNGTFTNYGEGGFDNWAYNGNIISTSLNYRGGATVTFGIPD